MTMMRSLEARRLATIRNRLLAGGKAETAVLKRDVVDCQEALITANEALAELEEANANQRRYILELEVKDRRRADLEYLLEHILMAYPGIRDWPIWNEVMQS